MSYSAMIHFSLNTAALCVDCSEVGCSLGRCACCGSYNVLALAPILNRETVDEYAMERVLWEMEKGAECKRA